MPIRDHEKRKASQREYAKRRKLWRAAGLKVDRWILEDSKRSDKKFGRVNDLDRKFIAAIIKHGCYYCGETSLRMTLDRIDNSLGHLKSNVIPACQRCNYIRRDMPFEAWRMLWAALRNIRTRGLFKSWTGCSHKRGL